MKKDWKYILYLLLAFGLFAFIQLISPKQFSWYPSYAHEDKNPYGTYILHQQLPSLLNREVTLCHQTIYELKDSLQREGSIFMVGSSISPPEEDCNALLDFIAQGGTALVSSNYFYGPLRDSLGLDIRDQVFGDGNAIWRETDSTYLRLSSVAFDSTRRYYFQRSSVYSYFHHFDSARTTVVARNAANNPVALRITWGKGQLILSCTPMAFTNIYLLHKDNHRFASALVSYLPDEEVLWTEFYERGRLEAGTPLRFILQQDALRWAYYLTVISLLVFIVFEMKRKQRIIPIVKPLANTSLEFVTTVGNLYFQSQQHKGIAEKKIAYFLDLVRSRFLLKSNIIDHTFIEWLSKKSGYDETKLAELGKAMREAQAATSISAQRLMELNKKLEDFYRHIGHQK